MANSLNPDAPIFISSRYSAIPPAPLQPSPVSNPNPSLSYSSHPFYLQIQQAPRGTSNVYTYQPPQYLSYQCFSFPRYYYSTTYQLISPPCAPAVPPSVPTCSIEELDENLDRGKTNADDQMAVVEPMSRTMVLNRRRIRASKEERSMVRVPNYQEQRRRTAVKVSHRNYEINGDANLEWGGKTTLMIKNLPSKFCKGRLIAILRDHCIEENRKACESEGDEAVVSEFDYFYLPIDFNTNSNFGYAFVNFTSPIGAWRLYKHLHNHPWTSAGSNKKCEVNYARIQGLAESIEHADHMNFNPGVPDVFLPVHFEPPYNGLNKPIEYLHGRRM